MTSGEGRSANVVIAGAILSHVRVEIRQVFSAHADTNQENHREEAERCL